MQCERAEEYFSDYLERTLERPMQAALEAHLAGCARCREALEALEGVCAALDSVPAVAPPRDGAWQVMLAIRRARAARLEAERAAAPLLWQWLRALNPMSAALGASLATLIIGGTLVVTGIPHVQHGILPAPAGRPLPAPPVAAPPRVEVVYGRLLPAGRELLLRITTPTALPAAQLRVERGGQGQVYPVSLAAGQTQVVTAVASPGAETETFRLTLAAENAASRASWLVVVPLVARPGSTLTLNLVDQPLEAALQQLAPALGRPIVSSITEAPVTLQGTELSAFQALRGVAAQLEAEVRIEDGAYRLAPRE